MLIECPKCGEKFALEQSHYDTIVAEIRNAEFEKELSKRAETYAREKEAAVELAVQKAESQKDKLLAETKSENEKKTAELKEANDRKINELEKQLQLKTQEIQSLQDKVKSDIQLAVNAKDSEIQNLKSQLQSEQLKAQMEKNEAVQKITAEKDKVIHQAESKLSQCETNLKLAEKEKELSESTIRKSYEEQLKFKDEVIEQYKNFKARLSTKMIGESLEVYCHNEVDKIRASAFPNAYFEKDNAVSDGTKGDFIFRESTEDGIEFISIMFEMKNQNEETESKHKNEDFFKKLDSDRTKKKCEYAVLVSTLEEDNDLYNMGIVDVSHRYPKMFVIRPQFFIPLIQVLRNAALKSIEAKRELKIIQDQERDVTNFEENIELFKESFLLSYNKAKKNHDDAIADIEKIIANLSKVRDMLAMSNKHLDTTNNKIENDLTIKKLTHNAPSVRAKLDDIREGKKE